MNFPTRGARRRTGRTGTLLGLGVAGALIVLTVIVATPACSNYSEGERCQSANGDDDCQTGLTCTAAAQLTNTQSDRCCPSDRTLATETVCKAPTASGGVASDAAASADTGISTAADGSTPDASDAGNATDAISDARTDG